MASTRMPGSMALSSERVLLRLRTVCSIVRTLVMAQVEDKWNGSHRTWLVAPRLVQKAGTHVVAFATRCCGHARR